MKPARLALASLSILAAAAAFYWFEAKEPLAFWSFPVLAALSPLLLLSRRSGLQLAARAIWVSTFLVGALAGAFASGTEQTVGLVIASGSVLAVALAGGIGLGGHRGADFSPLFLRRSLMLSLVFVGIGFQWLAVIAGVALHGYVSMSDLHVLLCARFGLGALGLGFVGMLRLKVWGFVLAGGACLALVTLSGLGAAGASNGEQALMLSGISLFFGVPVLVAARVLVACVPERKRAR